MSGRVPRRSGLRASSRVLLLAAAAWLLAVPIAAAQTGRQVLLLINGASPSSVKVGEHYARVRGVPAGQVIKLTLPVQDQMSRLQYDSLIEKPLQAWFARTAAHDRILYIVLTKGVPLRITGTEGLQGTVASVDSELTLLYRRMTGQQASVSGRIDNPYFLGAGSVDSAKPFSHVSHDIFLVSRLDGYTVDEVIRLIDRGAAPASRGSFVLDMKAPAEDRANAWLQTAADRLGAMGFPDRVVLDKTERVLTNEKQVLGYYSWGSNDTAIKQRTFGLDFVPGALAAMFVSTDGRTFTAPPERWTIGSWEKPESFYAHSPQSLAGDLIRAGVTGVAGHVAEPYLDATIRPEILFPAYVSGFNLVEAYALAMPYLSWQTVVVGDPLCAPFPRTAPPSGALEPPLDPISELPIFFTQRSVAIAADRNRGLQLDAIKLMLRAEHRLAAGDAEGAQQALEEGTALESGLVAAQHLLAQLYDQRGFYEKAAERHRQILAVAPNDIVALNNLAFALAVRQGHAEEARPFAERAYTLSQGAPLIADTLGWVLHLAGDQAGALRHLQEAVNGLPAHGEVRLHYAVALAAAGRTVQATQELTKALELDISLKSRPEVTSLERTLKGASH